jgi:hypothetical protein
VRAAVVLVWLLGPGCAVDAAVWDPVPAASEGDSLGPAWPDDQPLPAAFDTPPWLTMPSAGTISIGWWTVDETTARVELSRVGVAGLLRLSVEEEPALLHHVSFDALPAGAAFSYRITLDGSGASREGVFATPGASSWRFVHIGELHAPSRADTAARFGGAIRAFRPLLVVESGDMVDDGDDPEGWRSYLRASQAWISNVILLPAHSNHVNGFLGNPRLLAQFELPGNERWYTTRFGQVEVFTLDSTFDGESPDVALELEWARAQAEAARDGLDDPTFLVGAWHYPACSSQYPGRTDQRRWVIDQLLPAFAGAGGLDLVLVGHDKYYERSWLDDGAGGAVHVMTNAGLLSPRDDQASEPECEPAVTYTDVNSMLLVEVDGEVLEGRAIDPSGAELDRFEIDRRVAR